MWDRVSSHLRHGLVGYLALFMAMSGSAWAGVHVGARDIADNAVRSRHIRDGEVGTVDLSKSVRSSLQPSCPKGWTRAGMATCFRPGATVEATDYASAMNICTRAGRRLPTQAEAWMLADVLLEPGQSMWTELSYREGAGPEVDVAVVLEMDSMGVRYFRPHALHAGSLPHCVITAT